MRWSRHISEKCDTMRPILLILIALVVFSIFTLPQLAHTAYRDEWLICSRYLAEGNLYRDKPYCVHPPLVYALTLVSTKVFGFENLQTINVALVGLSLAAIWAMMSGIISRERLAINRDLFNVLFIFLIVANATDLLTLMPIAFLLAGFIVFRQGPEPSRLIVSGILFSVSILFKVVTSPIIAALLLHDVVFVKTRGRSRLVVPATIASVALLFYLAFPNMVSHVVTAQAAYGIYTFRGMLEALSPLDGLMKQKISFYILSLYLAYLFLKNRDIFSFLSLTMIPFFLTHILRGGISVIYTLYYYIPFNVFIIFALLFERTRSRKDSARRWLNVFVLVVVILYMSPIYKVWPLSEHLIDPDLVEFQYGFKFLPAGGRILTGYDNREHLEPLFKELGLRMSDYDFEYLQDITETYGIDSLNAPMMLSAGIVKDVSWEAEEKKTLKS
ncbi:MAG: glycosyltransferase family 39 protein [Candidatus Altiarchaeota archaeon]